jgi:hypothetical protein
VFPLPALNDLTNYNQISYSVAFVSISAFENITKHNATVQYLKIGMFILPLDPHPASHTLKF